MADSVVRIMRSRPSASALCKQVACEVFKRLMRTYCNPKPRRERGGLKNNKSSAESTSHGRLSTYRSGRLPTREEVNASNVIVRAREVKASLCEVALELRIWDRDRGCIMVDHASLRKLPHFPQT